MVIELFAPEDFLRRPNYCEYLEFGGESGRELLDIVADYNFPEIDTVKCGISGCRTPHRKGYLVSTSDGLETNIGNVCGKKNLGAVFVEKRNAFRQKQSDLRSALQAGELRVYIEEHREAISSLEARASILARLKLQLTRACPELCKLLLARAKVENASLIKRQPMSDAAARKEYRHRAKELRDGRIESFEAWKLRVNPKEEVKVGEIQGLKFWIGDLNLLVRKEILNKVEQLEKLDDEAFAKIDRLTRKEFSRFAQDFPRLMKEAMDLITLGEKFFRKDNIRYLVHTSVDLPWDVANALPDALGDFARRHLVRI